MKKVIICSLILCFCFGCNGNKRKDEIIKTLPTKDQVDIIKDQIKTEIVYKNLGWLERMLIIGAVLSIIACFMKFPEIGIPVFIGCAGGLGLISARIYHGEWMGYLALIAGVLVAVYSIWINRKSFYEVVAGGETFKITAQTAQDDISIQKFRESQNKTQSKLTKYFVSKVQKKINGGKNA